MTPDLLQRATDCTPGRAALLAAYVGEACAAYGIDTPVRLAAFLAQVGHESGSLNFLAEVWGPTPAQERYEGRADLGNVQEGDGKRFKGRGLLQITGRANFAAARDRMRRVFGLGIPDFESAPEALEQPRWAALAAGDFWAAHRCNELADAGDFEGLTRRINGGTNGMADRLARWERAKTALAAGGQPVAAEPPATPIPPTASPPPRYLPAGEGEPQESTMPLLDTLGIIAKGVISIANPVAGAILAGFEPLAREKIEKEMARHTDRPEVAQQTAAALLDAAKKVTGLDSDIQAAAEVERNPDVRAKVQEEALARFERLMPLMERINAMEQANISAARKYNTDEPMMVDTKWLRLRFIHLLSIAFVSFCGWFVTTNWGGLTAELKGAVTTLMIIAGWNGVRDYWMGSSSGSDRKTAAMLKQEQP